LVLFAWCLRVGEEGEEYLLDMYELVNSNPKIYWGEECMAS
jgi:hypothetical protein